MKPDANWIRARRRLLRQIKSEVQKRLGPEPADVQDYSKASANELRKRWRASSKSELLSEIEGADFVYGGDFHALGQAQRTHLKILRSLSSERPVILALEAFPTTVQKWLDAFLKGDIGLDELRTRTRWESEWGFPWENYRPLLEIAQRRGFRLLALNKPSGARAATSLKERDRFAARQLRQAYLRTPGALIYVIFGELHVAREHLPNEVRKQLHRTKSLTDVIVHLNSEKIYFQLAKQGMEHAMDVVRFGRGRFCVLSSPPWVQWQSYLLFLDQAADPDLEEEDGDAGFDPTDQVGSMIRLAAQDLGLAFKLDDLAVYGTDDEGIWNYLEKHLNAKERELARYLLAAGRSFFIPKGGVGYLAQPTINQAAHIAGQYIQARLSGRKRALWGLPADFQALIWSEAVAFFISKLINHKRQSETLTDLRAQLAVAGPADQKREAMRVALDHRMSEIILLQQGRRRRLQVKPRRRASYIEAARILGGMMGERLYLAFRSRKLKEADLVRLMKTDVTGRDFAHNYEDILRLLGKVAVFKEGESRTSAKGGRGSRRADEQRGTGRRSVRHGETPFEGIKSRKERL